MPLFIGLEAPISIRPGPWSRPGLSRACFPRIASRGGFTTDMPDRRMESWSARLSGPKV